LNKYILEVSGAVRQL